MKANMYATVKPEVTGSERRDARAYHKDFLRYLIDNFRLDPYASPHGVAHWMRVMRNGLEIARHVDGANTKVIRLFAIIHDSERYAELHDREHGFRAAMMAHVHNGHDDTFSVNEDELELLTTALTFHSDGYQTDCPTVGACWDADRLDLLRVGIHPNPDFLCHAYSKQFSVMYAANKRAIRWRTLQEKHNDKS